MIFNRPYGVRRLQAAHRVRRTRSATSAAIGAKGGSGDRIGIETSAALCQALPLSPGELRELVDSLARVLGLSRASFELQVTDDAALAELNQRFCGVEAATNVLSFPGKRPKQPRYIGEMAVSAQAAYREAILYGQEPVEHLARLLAHGLLHLAGYDHGPAMEAMTETAVRRSARAAK